MKWDTEVRAGTYVELEKTMQLKSFNGEVREVKAGRYYVNGFWADICGLAQRKGESNFYCIESRELINFKGITA